MPITYSGRGASYSISISAGAIIGHPASRERRQVLCRRAIPCGAASRRRRFGRHVAHELHDVGIRRSLGKSALYAVDHRSSPRSAPAIAALVVQLARRGADLLVGVGPMSSIRKSISRESRCKMPRNSSAPSSVRTAGATGARRWSGRGGRAAPAQVPSAAGSAPRNRMPKKLRNARTIRFNTIAPRFRIRIQVGAGNPPADACRGQPPGRSASGHKLTASAPAWPAAGDPAGGGRCRPTGRRDPASNSSSSDETAFRLSPRRSHNSARLKWASAYWDSGRAPVGSAHCASSIRPCSS